MLLLLLGRYASSFQLLQLLIRQRVLPRYPAPTEANSRPHDEPLCVECWGLSMEEAIGAEGIITCYLVSSRRLAGGLGW